MDFRKINNINITIFVSILKENIQNMKYQFYDLGQLQGGEIIEVTLSGNSANVKLMDGSNFSSYKANRNHKYYGGHVTKSPYKISVPNSGKWYITIDMGGFSGSVSSSIKIL